MSESDYKSEATPRITGKTPMKSRKRSVVNPDIGLRIAEVRKARALTQHDVAKRSGSSVGTLQGYEHGRVGTSTPVLERLAWALQCEPAELLQPPGAPVSRIIARKRRHARSRRRLSFVETKYMERELVKLQKVSDHLKTILPQFCKIVKPF